MTSKFDKVPEWEGTYSVKWERRREHFGTDDVLPLWIADLDFKCAQPIIDVLKERVSCPNYGYTDCPPEFYESVVQWMQHQHGWKINKDWIVATPRVTPALALAMREFSSPGDKVIVQPPVYHPFYDLVKNNGRQLVCNQLIQRNGTYRMNFSALKRQLEDPKVRIFILCNPHNPVGRVWTEEELTKLGNLCVQNDVLVIADEIHSDIVYEGSTHTPFASLSEEFALNSITCHSPSKTFNLSGLNIGYVIVPNDRNFERFQTMVQKSGLHLINLFGIEALIAAYKRSSEWYDHLMEYLAKNRSHLLEFVRKNLPDVRISPPEGTFLGWLDFNGLGLEPDALQNLLIEEAGVGLVDGRKFNPGGHGFQRLNFGCPHSLLTRALERIEKAVKN